MNSNLGNGIGPLNSERLAKRYYTFSYYSQDTEGQMLQASVDSS